MNSKAIDKDVLFAASPPPWPDSLLGDIRDHIASSRGRFVILDDDPTGGQTLSGVPVLASWDPEMLLEEVEQSPSFFLLTNSRALSEPEAVALAGSIGSQLRDVSQKSGRELIIGSRGDSTLRGHYPAETDALYRAFTGGRKGQPTCIFAPYFGEGGRLTFDDTQYVLQDSILVPVAETEFARDPAFAYRHSHLPSWLADPCRNVRPSPGSGLNFYRGTSAGRPHVDCLEAALRGRRLDGDCECLMRPRPRSLRGRSADRGSRRQAIPISHGCFVRPNTSRHRSEAAALDTGVDGFVCWWWVDCRGLLCRSHQRAASEPDGPRRAYVASNCRPTSYSARASIAKSLALQKKPRPACGLASTSRYIQAANSFRSPTDWISPTSAAG